MNNSEKTSMDTLEQLQNIINGVDAESIAKGLAISTLATLTEATNNIAHFLFEGNGTYEDVLKILENNISFIQTNLKIISDGIEDFDDFCFEVRNRT